MKFLSCTLRKFLVIVLVFSSLVSVAQKRALSHNIRIGYQQLQYIAAGDSINHLAEAQEYFTAGKYLFSLHPDLNLGIAKDNYWVTFAVSHTAATSKEFFINLENPRLNDVTVYITQKNSVVKQYRMGDNFSFYKRALYQNFFSFPVVLMAKDTQRIFLFIRHKGNTLQVPIRLMDNESFNKSIENNYMVTGITTGVLFLTFFFALFFYLQSKARLFVLYAGYSIFLWAWLWSTEGFGFQYLYPNIPDWATRLGPGISVLTVVFFIACCLQFCKPYDSNSRLRKILTACMYLLACWGILPFLPVINIANAPDMKLFLSVHFFLNLVSILLLVAYLLWVSIVRNKLVWYYFAAVIVSMACSLILVLKHSGVLDLPVSSGNFMSIGVIVELILMTAGITQQFYRYKKEKEEMLLAYLEQQKQITQQLIMTEEAERKRIARELHDDIGAGLTRITLMSDAAKNKINVSAKEIEEIAQTCRRLVGNMGEIVWSLNPENNSLELLMAYMREELHKLLEYSGIAYSLQLPEWDVGIKLSNELRRNILLVTKESVHNAVKYSQAKNISIVAELNNNLLNFKINDDGIGFNESTVRNGNGLRNIHQRIQEINGSISISSLQTKGTLVEFSVPIA